MIHPSPNNPGWAMWRDPDGITWEIRYIVTQFASEGAEYMEARPFYNGTGIQVDTEWDRLDDGSMTEETLKALDAFFHGPMVSPSIDVRAFDRQGKQVKVEDFVRVVQGELGYDADMAEAAQVVQIVSDNEIKIQWSDEVHMFLHPYDVNLVEAADELPNIWEVFTAIRIARDDIARIQVEDGPVAALLVDALEILTKYGDYDEPLTSHIVDALVTNDPDIRAALFNLARDNG